MSFRVGHLTDCEGRLQRDFVEFARLWDAVQEDWQDDRCRRFEREHLLTLGPSLNRFTVELRELCETIRKADLALKDDRESAKGLD